MGSPLNASVMHSMIKTGNYLISVVVVTFLIGLLGCAMGDRALEKMTPEQRLLVHDVLEKITPEMTEDDLVQLLGPVRRGAGTNRPVWLGPHKDTRTQIAVYFENGKIRKIAWLKWRSLFRSFYWSRNVG